MKRGNLLTSLEEINKTHGRSRPHAQLTTALARLCAIGSIGQAHRHLFVVMAHLLGAHVGRGRPPQP